uniref:Pyrin domain-containing protein n=1 Tax=Chelonoidis abingdonii TaxID=106734 RepID=A0A8C0GWQ8_CHEAB
MGCRELLETLEMLGEGELQRFKDKLSEIQPKKRYQHLPSESLRNANPTALTDLLLLFYGTDYGAEVAAEVLRAIDQGALAKRIERLTHALRHVPAARSFPIQELHTPPWGHFVDRHQEKLIQRVSEVDRVLKLLRGHTLTPEQYQSISTGRSNVEKMQKLYELVPSWQRDQKDWLYRYLLYLALTETNRDLVEELEGK